MILLPKFTVLALLINKSISTHLEDYSRDPSSPKQSVDPKTASSNQFEPSPRIADVISHLESGPEGLDWIDDDDGQGSYVIHTFEEWAAAEDAILGYKANTFAHSMSRASGTTSLSAIYPNNSTQPSDLILPETGPKHSRRSMLRRDNLDGGHEIEGGVITDDPNNPPTNRAARFFCYKAGQWGSTIAFGIASGIGCGTVANVLKRYGVIKTWRSYRLPEPPAGNHVYAVFLQQASFVNDQTANAVCTSALTKFRDTICQAEGIKPDDKDKRADDSVGPIDQGPFVSRGGVVRVYDSDPGTPVNKLGKVLLELKVDPNTCHKDANPC